MKLHRFIGRMRAPVSGEELKLTETGLVTSGGREYPFVDSSVVLMDAPEPWNLRQPGPQVVSKNISEFIPPLGYRREDQLVLHLGSGAVPCNYESTLSLDVLPLPNVDVVCWAEHLPFADDSVDAVVSGAVFEHLRNPLAAIREVKRVLNASGIFSIDTAFLQPYHGFPAHYFNMTPLAIEAHLCGAFRAPTIVACRTVGTVQGGPVASYAFLSFLPERDRHCVRNMPVGQLLDSLTEDPDGAGARLVPFSEHNRRSASASLHRCDEEALRLRFRTGIQPRRACRSTSCELARFCVVTKSVCIDSFVKSVIFPTSRACRNRGSLSF